jgi:hypothetical protein
VVDRVEAGTGEPREATLTTPATLSLFAPRESRPQVSPRAPEQAKQAARVGRGIDADVMRVARSFAGRFPFHLEEFTQAVRNHCPCAPDSPRRRLRALIAAGFIAGSCIDRSRSLWRIDGVSASAPGGTR